MLHRTIGEGRRPVRVPCPRSSLVHTVQVLLRAHTTSADPTTGRHVHRPDGGQGKAVLLTPGEEGGRRTGIGSAGVRVANLRREELDVAGCGVLALGHDGGGDGQLAQPGRGQAAFRQRRQRAGQAAFPSVACGKGRCCRSSHVSMRKSASVLAPWIASRAIRPSIRLEPRSRP